MKNNYFIPISILFASFLVFVVYSAITEQTDYFFFKWIRKIPYGDKIGHISLLGTMSLFLNLALQCKKINVLKYRILFGSFILSLIATLEEISQIFFPSRTFDLVDLTFNYLGIFIFGRLAVFLKNKFWKNG